MTPNIVGTLVRFSISDIRHTLLTKEQVEAILNQSLVQTSLKRLVLGRVSGVVEQDLVVRAQQGSKEILIFYVT